MTMRKRTGRTTPKGTKNPTRKATPAAPPATGPRSRREAAQRKGGNSTGWVARPITHNRGNR